MSDTLQAPVREGVEFVTRSSPAPRQGTIQRFPASVHTDPYDGWAETTGVTQPDEGAKGGVYFLHSNNDPIRMVVVKPFIGDEGADQSQFGDAFLGAMGISVPSSRVVPRSEQEFAAISGSGNPSIRSIYNAPVDDGPQPNFDQDVLGFKVMAAVPVPSLARSAKNLVTQQDVDSLTATFMRDATLRAIGRMIVADAAIGNDDRIAHQGGNVQVNLGNIMAGPVGEIWAIDTASFLRGLGPNESDASGHINETRLILLGTQTNVDQLADGLLDAIAAAALQSPVAAPGVNPTPAQQLASFVTQQRVTVRTKIWLSVTDSLQELSRLLSGPDPQRTRAGLKAESNRAYGVEDLARNRASWRHLKAKHAGYLADRTADQEERVAETGGLTVSALGVKAYLARRDIRLHQQVRRALKFGIANRITSSQEVIRARTAISRTELGEQEQSQMMDLRAGSLQSLQVGTKEGKLRLESRLNAVRAALLREFARDPRVVNATSPGVETLDRADDVAAAAGDVASRAAELRADGIGNLHFTKSAAKLGFEALLGNRALW